MLHRLLLVSIALAATAPAAAQSAVAVEGIAGYAAFVDDSPIEHFIAGAAARFQMAPRHGVGPEVVYMRGPGLDRDWFVTLNYTYDFFPQGESHPHRRVNPFVVAGGGFSRHHDQYLVDFSSGEFAVTGGGGARIWLTDRVYALGEFRMGWELHTRVHGGIGMRWQ